MKSRNGGAGGRLKRPLLAPTPTASRLARGRAEETSSAGPRLGVFPGDGLLLPSVSAPLPSPFLLPRAVHWGRCANGHLSSLEAYGEPSQGERRPARTGGAEAGLPKEHVSLCFRGVGVGLSDAGMGVVGMRGYAALRFVRQCA